MARQIRKSDAEKVGTPTVAVIGAGLTGIACARTLRAAGLSVTVFERNERAGGRCATRETEVGGFDHGLQYFTSGSGLVAKLLSPLIKSGTLVPWKPSCRIADKASVAGFSPERILVGVPSAASAVSALAKGLNVVFEHDLAALVRGADNRWRLQLRVDQSGATSSAGETAAGTFDIVLLALAADQALPLLSVVPKLAAVAKSASHSPVWSLMLAFAQPLNLPFDVALPAEHRMMWLAKESAKPGRRAGERWVLHASVDWSREHLDDDPYRVQEKLLAAFHRVTGTQVQPVFVQAHRWRFGAALQPSRLPALWDPVVRVGAAGDWMQGQKGAPKVAGSAESAMASGIALANLVLKSVGA
jgi:predicted NAD/FAD-dependent oxidoreductase